MLRLDTKAGIIVSGCASIAFAITYLALMDNYFWRYGMYELGIHISGLQILASLCLIVGAVKNKHIFFVPWMITTAFFMYLMGYVAIVSLANGSNWVLVPTLIVPFAVFLGYALYSVQMAFDRMRKEEPPAYTNLDNKKDFVNYI